MVEKLRSRLTFANVVSTLALFIALGGSSYAAVTLSGSSIENRSIPARKLRHNTVGGYEIRESTLARVPRARNADKLGGVTVADLKIKCPTDTFPVADVCVERSPRAATSYSSAVLQCLQVGTPRAPGRRLPTHGELLAALGAVQLAAGGELTANVYPSTSTPGRVDDLYITDQVGGVALAPDTAAGAKAYRCVTDPLN